MNTPPTPRPGVKLSPEEAAGILRNWRDENRRLRFHTFQVPEEAKAMLTATALPDSPVVRELLEWIAELEKRPTKA